MSSHGKTRLVCRVLRLRDAMTGSRASAHVAQCPDCQAYYRASDTLIGQLRQNAPHTLQPLPDDLAQRISRAVRHQSAPQSRRSTPVLKWTTPLAGAAAIIVAVLAIHHSGRIPPSAQTNQASTTLRSTEVAELVTYVDSLSSRLITSVGPTAEKLATDNPLTQEISSMQADARSALGFLALNFLPTDSTQRLESRPAPTRI